MASLVLNNIPESVYQRLAERARQGGKSIDAVAIDCLSEATVASHDSRSAVLKEIEQFHVSLGRQLDHSSVQQFKEEGRL